VKLYDDDNSPDNVNLQKSCPDIVYDLQEDIWQIEITPGFRRMSQSDVARRLKGVAPMPEGVPMLTQEEADEVRAQPAPSLAQWYKTTRKGSNKHSHSMYPKKQLSHVEQAESDSHDARFNKNENPKIPSTPEQLFHSDPQVEVRTLS
jgi:hypothetical protein